MSNTTYRIDSPSNLDSATLSNTSIFTGNLSLTNNNTTLDFTSGTSLFQSHVTMGSGSAIAQIFNNVGSGSISGDTIIRWEDNSVEAVSLKRTSGYGFFANNSIFSFQNSSNDGFITASGEVDVKIGGVTKVATVSSTTTISNALLVNTVDSITALPGPFGVLQLGSTSDEVQIGRASGGFTFVQNQFVIGNYTFGGSQFQVNGAVAGGVTDAILNAGAATSGSQLNNSPNYVLRGTYWNGSASVNDDGSIHHVMDSTAPTSHLQFVINNTQVATLNSSGTFTATQHLGFDGYILDASGGASTNETLVYNGTSFVPAPFPPNIIMWSVGTSWSTIYTLIGTVTTGQGVIVRLKTSAGSYHLTTGTYILDNITFEGDGSLQILTMDSGFTISDTGNAQLTVRNGVEVNTSGLHGTFAAAFAVNLYDGTLLNVNSATVPFIMGNSSILNITLNNAVLTSGFGAMFTLGTNTTVGGVLASGIINQPTIFSAAVGPVQVVFEYDDDTYIASSAYGGAGTYTFGNAGVEAVANTYSGSGAVTIDLGRAPAPLTQFTATSNVSSLTLSTGSASPVNYGGQRAVLLLVQDAAGTSTWPTTIANVKLPGGVFHKTTAANAVDRLDLISDGAGFWWAVVTNNYGTTSNQSLTVANASETHVTTTSATDILNYTTTVAGNYRVSTYYRVVTATSNITLQITWTDVTGAQTQTIVPTATPLAVGSYTVPDFIINATNATSIKLTATTGTANNLFVSGTIMSIT